MRREIIEFARKLFPAMDDLEALEMLLFCVYTLIDDIVFAQQEYEQYPDPAFSESEEDIEPWDYVY